jgi:UDP-N-acetylmuramoyl-tripeptide--D-alanyl-D-alanine ligase
MNLSMILGIVFGGIFTGWLFSLVCLRMLGILQQQGYRGKAFLKFCFKKGNLEERRLVLLAISLGLLLALVNLCFCFLGHKGANLVSALPFAGVILLYCIAEHKRALKVKANPTPRMIRLGVCNLILLAGIGCGLGFGCAALGQLIGNEWYLLFRFVYFALLPLVLPLVIAFSNLLMQAFEIPHGKKFVKKAQNALDFCGCKKAGITGSFGKTSVKNYAAAILSEKFRVIATPASYNTPLGIARAVNEGGLDCDIFLAEMGARNTGDIAELCDLVKPEYAVVTGVCCQHLETFGSLDAIKAEKCVLAERARCAVLGASADCGKEGALLEGRDFCAEEIALSEAGVSFVLRLGTEKIPVSLPLYGRHAAQDVALAAALCLQLGMTAEEIARGVANVKPVPHRLERIDANGLVILDDSYNSNVAGARDAVETLNTFSGKKYVVTPGLVELGALEQEENEALGASFVGLDGVILVGETRVLTLRNGYLNAGGDESKLRVVPTLEKAREIFASELSAGDCVLFLNDLPDCYR